MILREKSIVQTRSTCTGCIFGTGLVSNNKTHQNDSIIGCAFFSEKANICKMHRRERVKRFKYFEFLKIDFRFGIRFGINQRVLN